MADTEITLRPASVNSAEGKRSHARTADAAAADRVGTDDLLRWLHERHLAGWTLEALADAVGHTPHWVRWRLESRSGPGLTP